MSDRPVPVNCPCCQAPLPPPQDEFQITCDHCGAQIILKLPLDHRIEKLALEKVIMPLPLCGAFMISLVVGFFYGWPIWRFWLRGSGYRPLVQFIILSIVFSVIFVSLLGFKIRLFRMKKCAEQCDWSIAKLRALVKVQPTELRQQLLRDAEKNIETIKRQLDM